MSTLIIGGLLVVGIAALVALFFVVRGNETPQASTPAVKDGATPQTQQSNIITQLEIGSDTQTVAEAAVQPLAHEEEQPLPVRLNGQFHELAHGLRVLQQQATEMEQRLGSLKQIVETIDHDNV